MSGQQKSIISRVWCMTAIKIRMSGGEGVVSEAFAQTVRTTSKKIAETPVHQLPMTADSVKGFFHSVRDTIKSAIYGVLDAATSSVYNIALYFYNILYILMEAWFYHGPRWMPGFYGNAGMPESDICAKLIGTSTNLFQGDGSSMCRKYIHQIVTERCSFTCFVLVCLYFKYGLTPTYDFFYSIYNYKEYEIQKQLREKANEQSKRTKKRNADIAATLQAISAILRVDDTGFVSQLNALRNVLDTIKNEDVIETINWPTGENWISQGYSANRQMLMNLGNGRRNTESDVSPLDDSVDTVDIFPEGH